MNALQNLLTTPGVVSVESLEGHQEMPPLPIQAQAASDLESNMKLPNKNNKNPQVNKKKETKADNAKITPNKQHVNGTSTAASYAAVAAATEQPTTDESYGFCFWTSKSGITRNYTNF